MSAVNQTSGAEIDRGRGSTYSWLLTCPPSDSNFTYELQKADAGTIQAVLDNLPEANNKARRKTLEARLRKLQKLTPKNETIPATNETGSPNMVVAIETSLIDPSDFEPQVLRRKRFKDDDLDRLGASIERFGLLQPIRVRRRHGGRYQIVFGEQRFIASVRKGFTSINCFVSDLSDAETLELQYAENHRRLEPNALEDAFYFQFLIETEGYTSDRIADRFDWEVQKVRRFLKLNDLIREAKEELSRGILPLKHAVYLASFPEESQQIIVQKQFAYKYHDREEKATSFDDFKAQIEAAIIRRLADASFDTYDTRLRWDGLVCADCNQRSGFPGQLFPELKENDSCLNKYCYAWKSNRHLKLQREAIAGRVPNPAQKPMAEIVAAVPLVTAKSWTDEKTPFVEKVLTNQKLLPEPECEFAEASLVIDGERKGKEAFICRNESCAVHNRAAAAINSELKKKEDDFNRKVAVIAKEKTLAGAIEFFDDYKPVWMFDDLIQLLMMRLWHSIDLSARKSIQRTVKGFPDDADDAQIREFFAALDRRRQSQLIFLFIHQNSPLEEVRRIATDYTGRDYALFDAEARFHLAPEEFKQQAAEYLACVASGIPAEIPAFWWGFDEEAADACELEVE